MNITFLIGNGFDIASGIDTAYESFYEWYIKQPSSSDNIQALKDDIESYMNSGNETWADFEIGLGQYTQKFNKDTFKDFFECYEDVHNGIIAFLNMKKQEVDYNKITEDDITRIRRELLEFYSELSPVEIQAFNQIISGDAKNSTVINFISFNYTDLLNKIIMRVSKMALKSWNYGNATNTITVNPKVINVNGTLAETPILGVGEEYQIKNKDILSTTHFKNIMIKPECVKAIGQFWHRDAIRLIEQSNIICVYGMSLGSSDSVWWTRIMDRVRNNDNVHLIIYWYMQNPPAKTSILNLLAAKSEIKQRIYDYTDMLKGDEQKIDDRVHIVINTNRIVNIRLPKKTHETGKLF